MNGYVQTLFCVYSQFSELFALSFCFNEMVQNLIAMNFISKLTEQKQHMISNFSGEKSLLAYDIELFFLLCDIALFFLLNLFFMAFVQLRRLTLGLIYQLFSGSSTEEVLFQSASSNTEQTNIFPKLFNRIQNCRNIYTIMLFKLNYLDLLTLCLIINALPQCC